MDPEQLYQEVLQEEQQKGSSPAVAEGRAKAARMRAQHGSPHPKEPKWWPGGQPHLDGEGAPEAAAPEETTPAGESAAPAAAAPEETTPAGESAAPAAAAASEAAPAEPAPAEPAPGAQAPSEAADAPAAAPAEPAPAPAADEPPAAAPAPTEEPAAQPAAAAPQPAAQPAAAARDQTAGVRHGTATGTRLRPEDAVATEAQFEGERAMAARRQLIDELVTTGVPAVAAARSGRERTSLLAPLVYLVIVVLAVALVVNQAPDIGGAEEASGAESQGGGVATDTITAEGTSFDASEIRLRADQDTDFTLVNEDVVQHNVVIYESPDEASGQKLFDGDLVDGGSEQTYTIPALEQGEYFFNCEVHPTGMTGTVTVEGGGAPGGAESPAGRGGRAGGDQPSPTPTQAG